MTTKLKQQEKGFTIIEVLIVLAIAGLIILIVFLAVPALQRNSRNTQRSNDASQVGSAVNECLTNRNGVVDSCDELGELEALGLDRTKLQQFENINVSGAAPTDPGNVSTINVGYGDSCTQSGDGLAGTGSARQAVALYRVETQGGGDTGALRCLEM